MPVSAPPACTYSNIFVTAPSLFGIGTPCHAPDHTPVLHARPTCSYSNIFVTAPSPENLRTLFEFVFKGLDELDYKVSQGGCGWRWLLM